MVHSVFGLALKHMQFCSRLTCSSFAEIAMFRFRTNGSRSIITAYYDDVTGARLYDVINLLRF